jgi:indolepyruvate decarboxylase
MRQAGLIAPPRQLPPRPPISEEQMCLQPDAPITIRRLIARLNQALDANTVVIADPGDALFASSELVIHRQTEFVSPAYYTSMGFAVPAALGVMVARPNRRPIVLVGDGAFQMTGMELSTIVRHGFSPIVIVLDNKGYGTERQLHAGDHEFNNIQPWRYSKLPEILGGGVGYEIRTEGEFDQALRSALADTRQMSLLQVHLDVNDRSTTLERLAEQLKLRV